jgi:hypothetical protein
MESDHVGTQSPAVSPFAHPTKECNVVMQGGVTSGIVYPEAMLVLARDYRFRCLGGTSAGAIAAALTAAAEYARENGGFERLEACAAELRKPGAIEALMQPTPELRPLYDTLRAIVVEKTVALDAGWSWRGVLRAAARVLGRTAPALLRDTGIRWGERARTVAVAVVLGCALLIGALSWLGVRLAGAAGGTALRAASVTALLSLALSGIVAWILLRQIQRVGGVIGALSALARLALQRMPRQGFGLCTGARIEGASAASPPPLTDWLHRWINEIAGRSAADAPLTIRDLAERGITLRMVTTNLSQGRPFHLPLGPSLLANLAELRAYLPQRVVEDIEERGGRGEATRAPDGFRYLPRGNALPVVAAVRLSLSYPVLLSAVPLYSVPTSVFSRHEGDAPVVLEPDQLQRNWFSDGGISSNFPIHLFDEWLPRVPTFGFQLRTLPQAALHEGGERGLQVSSAYMTTQRSAPPEAIEAEGDEEFAAEDSTAATSADLWGRDVAVVKLPRANSPIQASWVPIETIPSFAAAIWSTAQNYRDESLAALPSYRERIVQIFLGKEEGGLNLAMRDDTVDAVMKRGRAAGELLCTQFSFREHQWVRLRALLADLEENLAILGDAMSDPRSDVEALLQEQLTARATNPFPYGRDERWVAIALARLERLRVLADDWGSKAVFRARRPKPEARLRITWME